MARVYKHCVVGHGLTGTAACKYLAHLGEDVVLVGPSEGHGAHGACYDEGRIYRILDPYESWARLAERSIGQYSKISAESGIDFYHESGLLVFGVEDDFIKQTREVAARMGTELEEMSPRKLEAAFPFLRVPSVASVGLLQRKQAGHLSPRKLCEAQLCLATRHGASYFDDSVEKIVKEAEDGGFSVELENGQSLYAENVLVAAGVYSSVLPLLPEEVVISLTGAQALLAEISAETAERLKGMPSMIYEGPSEEECFYLLPPIQYPDGSWLLKIGPSTAFAPPLRTTGECDAWFRKGCLDPAFEQLALKMLGDLFQDVEFISRRPLLCVTDSTPTQNAYIDRLAPGWGICTGGNGWAAKSSDAIGHLAAQMMALPQHWGPDPQLPQSWFRAVTPAMLLPTPGLETALARVEACGQVLVARAAEALAVLTQLLAQSPKLRGRPGRIAEEVRGQLSTSWGAAPSVLVAPAGGGAWAPSHPFVALSAGRLSVVIVLAG